jgi:hypothetical protein
MSINDFVSQFSHGIDNIYLSRMHCTVIPTNSVIPQHTFIRDQYIHYQRHFYVESFAFLFCFRVAHWSCIPYFVLVMSENMETVLHSPPLKHFRAWLVHVSSLRIAFGICRYCFPKFPTENSKSSHPKRWIGKTTQQADQSCRIMMPTIELVCSR